VLTTCSEICYVVECERRDSIDTIRMEWLNMHVMMKQVNEIPSDQKKRGSQYEISSTSGDVPLAPFVALEKIRKAA
jgi:hypothetical protein